MGRNLKLNSTMKEERRANILSGALRLFAANGLSATKISDIARETAMSQGLVYHYFDSKEAIFTELMKTAFEKLIHACTTLENMSVTPDQKIIMAIQGLVAGIRDNEDVARYHLLIAQASISDSIPEEARQIISEKRDIPYTIMKNIIQGGQHMGLIRSHDAMELSILFWTSINGLAIYRSSHGASCSLPDTSLLTALFIEEK
ncbi:MAG: hypothetical protein CVV64_11985 [Candidatus Wallbacteria bacterium HGW-Wallbacteria-1]|jgi:AcrR family transcriptional regulator|uniref:HTH tetR-type domain-containing protein n=1 Tax=Candidatus Wallbacteria bacterium HGW-Wallbacteria-1 TaxID=2013854 RepID=A0A2N1PNF1_9BACT|nr:MAG: hypothetical protein CVV64_11985 [Candidatus Wallbacteria bacterium HGW-Wallbacteria-1]